MKLRIPLFLAVILAVPAVRAGIELVTLPARETVQLTVYREVDLTLVRERRVLTFKKGLNRLEFSWAGTLIDPTSLELEAAGGEGRFEVLDRSYPPRVSKTLVWTVDTDRPGPRPVEISYFTSGVSWSASYQVVAGTDGATMNLDGDVRIINRSGEDFEGASVRLVVGHVRLVETIAELANRNEQRAQGPGGYPSPAPPPMPSAFKARGRMMAPAMAGAAPEMMMERAAKQIMKEGLADQYLFSIPGTETVKNQWTLRLPSVRAQGVPFQLVYKYDEHRWGDQVRSFFRLHNTEEGKLGESPLPAGDVQVFRALASGKLSFVGRTQAKYIPVGEKVELDLGSDPELAVEVKKLEETTDTYSFNHRGNVEGWDVTRTDRLSIRSGKAFPVKVEVERHLPAPRWTLATRVEYEKLDLDTVKLKFDLLPGGRESLELAYTWGEGSRRDVKR